MSNGQPSEVRLANDIARAFSHLTPEASAHEIATHIQAMYVIAAGRRLDVAITGGPSFFKVKPVDQGSSDVLRSLRQSFAELPNVVDVRTPDQAVAVLSQLKGFFGVRTMVIAIGLLLASALLIWNTIRTAMFSRRTEIEVMKLVGATDWFIRLPFMLEGLLQGIAGALLGGLAGTWALHRVNEKALRIGIVGLGLALSAGLFLRPL